jgi:hypothetical protein
MDAGRSHTREASQAQRHPRGSDRWSALSVSQITRSTRLVTSTVTSMQCCVLTRSEIAVGGNRRSKRTSMGGNRRSKRTSMGGNRRSKLKGPSDPTK